MKITELSVRRPVTWVMVFLCLTILGVFTFSRLKLDMLPNIEFPIVAVIATYPGAGPDAVEQLVTRPLEEAMASVQNVEQVNSTSNQGSAILLVEFAWGTDMKAADMDVRKNMELFALDRLPDDVPRPLTFAFDPSLQPVVFLTVNAPGGADAVRKLAEDEIEPFLSRIEGVAAAEVMGGTEREIQVRLLPEWLEAYGVPASQVTGALRAANLVIPGGNLDQGKQEFNISTKAEFTSVEEIGEVVVGQKGGVPVLLRDVATVEDTFQEQTAIVRADGQHAVMLAVRKQSDANTVQVANRVNTELAKLEKRLPEGASITTVFDQAEPISRSINNLSSSAFLAILLTAGILLAFLRSWRTSSIVLVSIPLSMLVTFAVMDFQGVTLNIISMAGLALAVGLLVDNSIIVLENIFSKLKEGRGPKDAAIEGTSEMAMPIVASTLTTVAVFAPILFVPGLAGQLFRDMSLTIVISLIASLAVALTLVPLMASLMVRLKAPNLVERFIGKFTSWVDPLGEKYAGFLGKALHHRKKIFAAAFGVFVGSLFLLSVVGVDFMAQTDEGRLQFTVKAGPGTSLDTTDALFKEAEAVVRRVAPEAEVIVSQFGGGRDGFAALFGQNSYTGNIQIKFPPKSQRERGQQELQQILLAEFKQLSGLDIEPQQQGFGGGGGDVVVKLFGEDLDRVRVYGERLKAKLEGAEGVASAVFSMEQGRPELSVQLDREQIRMLGLTPADVSATISTYFLGTTATMYREDGDEYEINVRAPKEVREDIERLRALPIVTPQGLTVPLETVATVTQGLGPTGISRENQRRLATVAISGGGTPLGKLIASVNGAVDEMGAEAGVTTVVAGTAEDLQESFMALGLAILVAIVLVYMVMASQFESLLEPFVILFSVPLAFSGVFLALAVTGTTLQVTALIGMILLTGIVVNNGIVLIDVLKRRRDEGRDLIEAAMEAGRSRMRPILMTTLTTVLGMIPLAFELGDGSELWAPMARAVIGGMMLSTLLTLVVIPAGYVTMAGWADRRRAKKQKKRAAKEARKAGEEPTMTEHPRVAAMEGQSR